MSVGSRDESHDCEFTVEEIRGREHTENWLRESFPWLEAESEVKPSKNSSTRREHCTTQLQLVVHEIWC
jgi:hypothetical protein